MTTFMRAPPVFTLRVRRPRRKGWRRFGLDIPTLAAALRLRVFLANRPLLVTDWYVQTPGDPTPNAIWPLVRGQRHA